MKESNEITYTHEWIYKLENPAHWRLYWHQLNLILNQAKISKDSKLIEIGVGSGLTSSYLKRKGYQIQTLDIDENKSPDILANILEDDLPEADVYLAFEILEHIPFESVDKVLAELSRNKVMKLLFSIPHAYKTYFFSEFWMPYIGWKTLHIRRKRNYINTENHFWELGIEGINLKKIEKKLLQSGYVIDQTYRFRNHQFFSTTLREKE